MPAAVWSAHGRFDLVTSGDAWHWIEPVRGAAQVARVLRPGGAFVRFWNVQMLDPPVMDALEPVYREHAPEVFPYGRPPPPAAEVEGDPFRLEGPLAPAGARTYLTDRHVRGDEWAACVATVSDHRRLAPQRLARLQAAIRAALAGFAAPIRVRVATMTVFARRDA